MEIEGVRFSCPNCGASVTIDFKTRVGTCDSCGYTTEFKRNFFNSNDKVINDLTNVVKYFKEKNYKLSARFAEEAMTIAVDNMAAAFVLAYNEAFIDEARNSKSIARFFVKAKETSVDIEELEPLKKMFLSCMTDLDDHEEDILEMVINGNHASEILEFTDAFSPYLIARRANIDFLTPRLKELYKRCAAKCSVPKTCYALLNSIKTNSESPYNGNTFFLRTKTERFYNDFVLPVGEIINGMSNPTLRAKFKNAYERQRGDFEMKMKEEN